jgi:hypothetical protein
VGPLTGSGLRLPFHSVVTTTWGEWRRYHPSTTVLSLETGYERNYAEGARSLPNALTSETGERLARVPAHRAFWFVWIAQHPETVLFK